MFLSVDYLWGKEEDIAHEILADRKPAWLDEWIAYDLDLEFTRIKFNRLRQWIKAGICSKPTVDGYYQKMVWSLLEVPYDKTELPKPPLSKQLLAEPDLLDDIWRLFEIENKAFLSDNWYGNSASENFERWPDALIKLSNDGQLDRNRLLDASLSGLLIDVKQNQLSGYHKFHERLKPTQAERTARQSEYLSLLCHQTGHVVKFALSSLKQCENDGVLDIHNFLVEVQSVFFQNGKGNAVTALTLIKRILKSYPEHAETCYRLCTEALRHANTDVQQLALDILKPHRQKLSDDMLDELKITIEHVAAVLKPQLITLIGDNAKDMPEDNQHDSLDIDQLMAKVSRLTPDQRLALGLDIRVNDHWSCKPISANIMDHELLPGLEPITPIADVDELIQAVLHAVEVVDSPDDVERILDAISRLHHDKSGAFNPKTDALLHRLKSGAGLSASNGIAGGWGGVRLLMADLLMTWLSGSLYHTPDNKYFSTVNGLQPARQRIQDIIQSMEYNKSRPLLAAPTHRGGWIDPVIWIQRLMTSQQQCYSFSEMDVCVSLLRLTPDNRQQALQQTGQLGDFMRRIAEFVLGGDVNVTLSDRKHYPYWIPAARSRDPYRDWSDFFAPMNLNDALPASVRPGGLQWYAYQKQHEQWTHSRLKLTVLAGKQPVIDPGTQNITTTIAQMLSTKLTTDWKRLPSAALHLITESKYSWSEEINCVWVSQWLAGQWPLCPDGAYITSIKQLHRRIDDNGSNWEPGYGYFYGLFQSQRPWRETGHLLLSMGLIGKDADCKGLAIDAMIAGIENGCLDIETLSTILVRLTEGGSVKLNRLADTLTQVAQAGLLHAWTVNQLLQLWLPQADLKLHNIAKMLELMHETQTITRQPLQARTQDTLNQWSGSSKAAKLAKAMINQQSDDISSSKANLQNLAIESRLLAVS
ncbi:MAG: hypothetical protein K0U68_12995 [Gammaproteobacteria bacterium]|nr:hypothetical protein [Gammaproteobacteria bacterium]